MKKGRKKTTEWREFERLVARIEQAMVPEGAVVKSPDRIRGVISGQIREVDASIRFRVGSVDLLVTVECRKRSAKQDVTWIEQLSTKKGAIGAARTIAVSSTGFSEEAQKAATIYGIELRTVSELQPGELVRWIRDFEVIHLYRKVELHRATLVFGTDMPRPSGSLAPVGEKPFSDSTGNRFSLQDIWLARQGEPTVYGDVAQDGTRVRKVVRCVFASTPLLVDMEWGTIPLRGIDLDVTLYWGEERISSRDGQIVQYAGPDGCAHIESKSSPVRPDRTYDLGCRRSRTETPFTWIPSFYLRLTPNRLGL